MTDKSNAGGASPEQRDGQPRQQVRTRRRSEEAEMLVRIMGASLALLSFAVVCLTGLLQGNTFASVVRGSLVALVVGGACGILVAVVVRVVVTEQFRKQYPEGDLSGEQAPAGSAAAERPATGAEQVPEQQQTAEPAQARSGP